MPAVHSTREDAARQEETATQHPVQPLLVPRWLTAMASQQSRQQVAVCRVCRLCSQDRVRRAGQLVLRALGEGVVLRGMPVGVHVPLQRRAGRVILLEGLHLVRAAKVLIVNLRWWFWVCCYLVLR